MSLKRCSVPENTQSTIEPSAFWAYSDMDVASGASAEVDGIDDDEPMCIDTVVSDSPQACHTGSQAPVYIEGRPSLEGFSEKATAKHPLAAQRRTSAAAMWGSHSGSSASGISRPCPAPPPQSSIIQSLYMRRHSAASSLSSRSRNPCPQNRGKMLGKLIAAFTWLMSMSASRAVCS